METRDLIGKILSALVGAGAGGVVGHYVGYATGKTDGALYVFTERGIPYTRVDLFNWLKGRGYTDDMLKKLADASVWELQCLVAARMIGEKYGLPRV